MVPRFFFEIDFCYRLDLDEKGPVPPIVARLRRQRAE